MEGKKKGRRAPTIEIYKERRLTFDEINFWDDLQDAARAILAQKGVPAKASVDMRGNTIEVLDFVCDHLHATQEGARACAREEADRRIAAEPKKYPRSTPG